MSKRVIAVLLLPLMLLQFGCSTLIGYGIDELASSDEPEQIRMVRTADGEGVELDEQPIPLIRSDTLYAYVDGEPYSIATDQISDYSSERPVDAAGFTALLLLGVVGVVLLIAVAPSFDDSGGSSDGGR